MPRVGSLRPPTEGERAFLRARIAVALDLALGNKHAEARNLLAALRPEIDAADNNIAAHYFHACALTHHKARITRESFALFEHALKVARDLRDQQIYKVVLEMSVTA